MIATGEVARQPGIHRDFQAERHRIGEHQRDGDIAAPDKGCAAQIAALARDGALFDCLSCASADEIPGRDEQRDDAEPEKGRMVIRAEQARQNQRAHAGTNIAGARIETFSGADFIGIEPLRDMLDADDEGNAGDRDEDPFGKEQFIVLREGRGDGDEAADDKDHGECTRRAETIRRPSGHHAADWCHPDRGACEQPECLDA